MSKWNEATLWQMIWTVLPDLGVAEAVKADESAQNDKCPTSATDQTAEGLHAPFQQWYYPNVRPFSHLVII